MRSISRTGWYSTLKFAVDGAAAAGILFLSAGTIRYAEGWVFLSLLALGGITYGLVMQLFYPSLLKKRLEARERHPIQLAVMGYCLLLCIGILCVSGLSVRFGWMRIPNWRYGICAGLALAGGWLYGAVVRENDFLSAAIQIQKDQTVIQTGPYRIVRHPMYVATSLLFLSAILLLGSVWALAAALLFLPALVIRILHEERILLAGLPAYQAYQTRVPYRLIPFLW